MQYKLWDWAASENVSHNSFFRNSCQYLHSSISSQAYWVLLLSMYYGKVSNQCSVFWQWVQSLMFICSR